MSNLKFFGVELSPDNIAVAMVYFVQGVLGLSRLAVSFYLKDDLHLDPAEVRDPCFPLICSCNSVQLLLFFLGNTCYHSNYMTSHCSCECVRA